MQKGELTCSWGMARIVSYVCASTTSAQASKVTATSTDSRWVEVAASDCSEPAASEVMPDSMQHVPGACH